MSFLNELMSDLKRPDKKKKEKISVKGVFHETLMVLQGLSRVYAILYLIFMFGFTKDYISFSQTLVSFVDWLIKNLIFGGQDYQISFLILDKNEILYILSWIPFALFAFTLYFSFTDLEGTSSEASSPSNSSTSGSQSSRPSDTLPSGGSIGSPDNQGFDSDGE
jgi:hypothetical protein